MFVACHLFIGLVIGLVIADRLGDRRFIGFSALGAVLPDLLDKPVGHILFAGSLNSGRIIGHGLLFLTLLIIVGIALWKKKGSFVLLAVAAGVASHQILDTMWTTPIAWYFRSSAPTNRAISRTTSAMPLWQRYLLSRSGYFSSRQSL